MASPIWIGTSGFSYDEWAPDFYPADLRAEDRLRYYAGRLAAVEIDSTFYRMPTPVLIDRWLSQTHDGFRFAIKASRKITHRERLALPSDALRYLTETVDRLGGRLATVLYQLPPFFQCDTPRLAAFLETLPRGQRSTFEFRHSSWFVPSTYRLLTAHGAALCLEDGDERSAPLEITAGFTYVRLRRSHYTDAELAAWKRRLSEWADKNIEVFAFLKHEGEPAAPCIAERLGELGSEAPGAAPTARARGRPRAGGRTQMGRT
jgi:uncharacterized protein YecE (DUF72 family)